MWPFHFQIAEDTPGKTFAILLRNFPDSKYVQSSEALMEAPVSVTTNKPTRPTSESRRGDWTLLGGLSFLLFLLHILVSSRYGYFVDELYYLACSHHLD